MSERFVDPTTLVEYEIVECVRCVFYHSLDGGRRFELQPLMLCFNSRSSPRRRAYRYVSKYNNVVHAHHRPVKFGFVGGVWPNGRIGQAVFQNHETAYDEVLAQLFVMRDLISKHADTADKERQAFAEWCAGSRH